MAGLDREDVLEGEGLLRITQGKGGTERVIPLHPDVLAALVALPMPESGVIFRRPWCRDRWPAHNVSHTINTYLHSLGIDSTAHALRHWFGTTIYQLTKDIRLTQELMGHSGPNTTAIYTNSQELHLTGDEPPGRLVGRFRSEVIGSLGRAA
jgi:integrase